MLRRRDIPPLLLSLIGVANKRGSEAAVQNAKDWETARPEEAGIRPAELQKLTAEIKAGKFPNTHAVLIERDGRLVYEEYFAGSDERWGEPLGKRTFDAAALKGKFVEVTADRITRRFVSRGEISFVVRCGVIL